MKTAVAMSRSLLDLEPNGERGTMARRSRRSDITRKRIRRGVFKSVNELKQAIIDYLDTHNDQPKPYVWTKTAAEIFTKVARAKQALESQH